jgi:hypothetical protein
MQGSSARHQSDFARHPDRNLGLLPALDDGRCLTDDRKGVIRIVCSVIDHYPCDIPLSVFPAYQIFLSGGIDPSGLLPILVRVLLILSPQTEKQKIARKNPYPWNNGKKIFVKKVRCRTVKKSLGVK